MRYSTEGRSLRPLQRWPGKTRKKQGPGRMGSNFDEKRVGEEDYQFFSLHPHYSARPPRSALRKTHGPRANQSDQGRQGENAVGRHSPLGGVPRSRWGLNKLARVAFSFTYCASTPKAAKEHLTQLAMEHSPKTLPISTTS